MLMNEKQIVLNLVNFWRIPLFLPLFMLLITGVAYGLVYALVGIGVNGGIPPLAFAFWMSLGAGLILLIFCLHGSNFPGMKFSHLRSYFATGISGFGVPYVAVTIATLEGVPVGITSMLVALAPILTYLGAVVFRLDGFSLIKSFGFIVGVAGVLLIVIPEASLPSPDLVGWVLLVLLAPFGYATSALAAALLPPPKSNAIQFSTGFFLAASCFLFIFMAGNGDWWWFSGHMSDADWALIMCAPLQALGIYLFLEIIRIMGPVFFTSVNFITPVTGILWGIAFFGEKLSFWVLIALIPLFMGVFFVNLKGKK
ncbi:MAG: hypothetical protein CMM30_06775 [Rhodospirillaceae bacterium]|nr:hypothetical protein [Rhodospirillaceae bacterium]